MRWFSRSQTIPLLVVGIWIGFLIYLVTVPEPNIIIEPSTRIFTVGHYLTHVIMAGLFYLVLGQSESTLRRRIQATIIATGLTFAISLAIEVLQFFLPQRSVEIPDIVFGLLGAISGAILVFVLEYLGTARKYLVSGSIVVVVGSVLLVGISSVIEAVG